MEYGRVEAFKILSQYCSGILGCNMSHLGSALAHAVLAKNRPLASFLLADVSVDPNEPRMYGGGEPPIV